ncbi:S1 RNA-binding domain-containing protein [Desulfobulbus propionicus]
MKHWEQFIARFNEGDSLDGVIEQITSFGLFITMPLQELKGLIHKSNLPEDFLTRFKIGQSLSVTIKTIRKEKYQVELLRNPSLCEEDEK